MREKGNDEDENLLRKQRDLEINEVKLKKRLQEVVGLQDFDSAS
jgi:hypothetical protein